jgi:hypothetical protein
MFGQNLLLFNNLNPVPPTASPWAGASGATIGVTYELAKGTPLVWTGVPVSGSLTRVVPSNSLRREIWVTNNSSGYLEMFPAGTASAGQGFVIPANATLGPLARHTGELWFRSVLASGDVRAWEAETN